MKPRPPHVLDTRRPKLPLWLGWLLGSFAAVVLVAAALAAAAILTGCEDHGDHATSSATAAADASALDPQPPGLVRWCFGGVNGSRADFDGQVLISGLKVRNPSGLTLHWDTKALPASWAKQNGLVLCCLFYQAADGSFKGGKFDWIDPARSTRDLKNPASGYGGWNWSEYLAAKRHALVILSADARRRSNWIFD